MTSDADLFDDLVMPDEDEALAALRWRLAAAATDAVLLDVAFAVVPSPVGDLVIAATTRGLVRVGFTSVDSVDHIVDGLSAQVSPRVLEAPARLATVARQLDAYFAGRRHTFDLALDLQLVAGFRRDVVTSLPTIEPGTTASYGEVATRLGNPGAARAVGTACARNPLPVVLPCHRVVPSDGSLGRYAGGVAAKSTLLELEGAKLGM